ncbi:MAG TPA: caspase family protein [Chitinophagaceae bacterium]
MYRIISIFILAALSQYSIAQKAKLILPVGITGQVDHIEVSSKQKYLFTTSEALLQVWDYQSGNELDSVTLPHCYPSGPKIIDAEKKLIAYEERNTNDVGEITSCNIHLYNFLTKQIVKTFSLGKKSTLVISFSSNQKYILIHAGNDAYSNDNIFLRFDIESGIADTLNANMQGINSISLSSDGELALLSPYSGGKAYLYNFKTKTTDSIETGEYCRYILANRSIIAVREDSIEIWEMKDHHFEKIFYLKSVGRIYDFDLTKDEKFVYAASNEVKKIYTSSGTFIGDQPINTKLEVFDIATKKITGSFILQVNSLPGIIKWSNVNEAVVAFNNGLLLKLNIVTGEKLNDFNGQSTELTDAFLIDQNKFLQVRKDSAISQLNTKVSAKTKEFSYKGYKILGTSQDGRFEILREIKADCDSAFRDTIMGKNFVFDKKTQDYKKINTYPVCDTSFLKILDTYSLSIVTSIAIPKDLGAAKFISANEVAFRNLVWNTRNNSYSVKKIFTDNLNNKTHITPIASGGMINTKFSLWNAATHKNKKIESGIAIEKIVYDEQKQQIICVGKNIIKAPEFLYKKNDATTAVDSMWQNLQDKLNEGIEPQEDYYSCVIKIYDIRSGKFIFERVDTGFYYSDLAISGDKKFFCYSKADGTPERKNRLEVLDIEKNKLFEIVDPFGNSPDKTSALSFSNDDRFLICTRTDKQITFFDYKKGEQLFSLFLLNSSDWIIQNKDGLFDATPGAMRSMYFVVTDVNDKDEPWKVIDFSQLKHRYYQPELLPILLGFKNEKLREVPAFNKISLPPDVELSLQKNKLSIQLKNKNGGIGKVSAFIDNTEIIEDARQHSYDSATQTLEITVDLNNYNKLINPNADNIIKVIAFNGEGWLSSKPGTIYFQPSGINAKGAVETDVDKKNLVKDIRLYGIVAGTSDYAGNNIDLKYASKDAKDFANALARSSANLFGKDNTIIRLLNSEAADSLQPAKKNIERILNWVSTVARPQDVLVVYLSGHGVNYGGQDGDFYYLTSTASGADAEYFKDPDIRNSVAISSAELTQILNKIAARKKILLLDACASGKAAENMMTAMKDVPASQVRALDRMADRTGFYILSGSAADAVSYESTKYGQGLLTYSLLKAIRGAALRQDGNEEYVDIQKLLQYAVDEVPLLAKGIGGIQQPLYRSPGDQKSYDIGKMDPATKKEIILAEPKPIFVATTFINIDENEDDLKLTQLVNAQLREITIKGKEADILFTEAKDYPDAWKMSGNYKIQNNIITLSYRLRKNDRKVDNIIKGNKMDLQNFIIFVMKEVRTTIAK